jgi:iron(III) transport system substrate-binding protein
MKSSRTLLAAATLTLASTASIAQAASEVNIYSYRQAFLIQPLLEEFSKETGIQVNLVTAGNGLLERLEHEGRNSPADILLTAEIGPLYDATEKGLLSAVESDALNASIPQHYRDPEGRWFGLTARSRIIYASKDRVQEGEIKTYEDLADPKRRPYFRSYVHTGTVDKSPRCLAYSEAPTNLIIQLLGFF